MTKDILIRKYKELVEIILKYATFEMPDQRIIDLAKEIQEIEKKIKKRVIKDKT